jgi:hypothetical protein
MATMARDYRQQPIHVSEVGAEVVALHRQNQVRQLKDTCPIDGLCIYNYQLATQVGRIDKFHLSRLEPNRKPGLRLAKHPKSPTRAPGWQICHTYQTRRAARGPAKRIP